MASLMDEIMSRLGDGGLAQISDKLGTDRKTAAGASSAAVAALLAALSRNAASEQGAASLDRALEKDHDGSILDDLSGFLRRPEQGPGEGILRHVLGARKGAVQAGIGRSTGVEPDRAGKLLEMLAPVVLGAIGEEKRRAGMDRRELSRRLGTERERLERMQPAAMGSLTSLLDSDGDGDLDMSDLAKHGAGLLGKFFGR